MIRQSATPEFVTSSPAESRRVVALDQCLRQVSVVVPLFNERECVTSLMESLVDLDVQLSDQYQFEFLLVDDGSSDGTPELLEEAIAGRENYHVVRHHKNCGIAEAIHTGLRYARHEVVVSIDADGSYELSLLEEMVPLLTDRVDMVTASPYHPLGKVEDVPRWRIGISRIASGLYRLAMPTKLSCYTSCFRVYRRKKVVALVPKNAGYVGVAELLWKVDRQGGQIVEHPAVLSVRIAGVSKMRVFRSALRHLRLIAQILTDRLMRSSPDRIKPNSIPE